MKTAKQPKRQRPMMECLLCHRHTRIPPSVAAEIDAGETALLSYVCNRCGETAEGRKILESWPTAEEGMR